MLSIPRFSIINPSPGSKTSIKYMAVNLTLALHLDNCAKKFYRFAPLRLCVKTICAFAPLRENNLRLCAFA